MKLSIAILLVFLLISKTTLCQDNGSVTIKDIKELIELDSVRLCKVLKKKGFTVNQSQAESLNCETYNFKSRKSIQSGIVNLLIIQTCDGSNRSVLFKTADSIYFQNLKTDFINDGFEYKTNQINKSNSTEVVYEIYRKLFFTMKTWIDKSEGITQYCIAYKER